MIFDIEETSGISDIGISLAIVFLDSFLVSMIDFDSFFDGVKGIDEVVDVSMNIWFGLILDFFAIFCLNSSCLFFDLSLIHI